MTDFLDELSPRYVGEDRISLTLDSTDTPQAGRALLLNVDYSATMPEGVVLPLILTIVPPSEDQEPEVRVFRRRAPTSIPITPREGGVHLVSLREAAHNRWWGRLRVTVSGELTDEPRPV